MDLINRYIYAVTRSLPEKQRGDIDKELKTLIDDMIEENDEAISYDDKVKKVLTELGDPEILADNYRGSKRHLIGPKYYDTYLMILKIVLISVFVGITVAIMVQSIFSKDQNGVDIATNYITSLFNGGLQAFAWVTIVFTIAERSYMNASKSLSEKSMEKNNWNPSQLPVIPEKKAAIPMHEPILSIILSTIFLALLYSTPQVFAAYFEVGNEIKVIPVFDQLAMKGFGIIILSVLFLQVLKEVLKLYSRRWTLRLSLAVAVISVMSTILILCVFASPSVWNPDFSNEIMKNAKLSVDFVSLLANIKTGFFVVIVVISVIDIISTLYKGIRYSSVK